jgi:lipopolysaccharide export system permease protein
MPREYSRSKTIELYILKELLFSLLISMFAVNMVLMMEKILRMSRLLSGVGASLWDMLALALLVQPPLSILTIPMALMMAVLFTYTRLNVDSETVVLRTSGMSFAALTRPVLYTALACFALSFVFSAYLGPLSSRALRARITNIIALKSPAAIKEGVFYTLLKDVMIFVGEKPAGDPGALKNVFIQDRRDNKRPWVIYARDGRIRVHEDLGITFELRDGSVYMADGQTVTQFAFELYRMVIKITPQFNIKLSEYTPPELLETAQRDNDASAFLELHRRITLPLLALVVGLLAPALAFVPGKTGRLGGLTYGVFVFALYYGALVYFENLAKSGRIPHYVGGYAAFALILAAAVWMFARESRR